MDAETYKKAKAIMEDKKALNSLYSIVQKSNLVAYSYGMNIKESGVFIPYAYSSNRLWSKESEREKEVRDFIKKQRDDLLKFLSLYSDKINNDLKAL